MKHLSLKIIFICVVLPPVLYIFSIQGMEAFLQHKWKKALRPNLISHPEKLIQGSKKVQEEVKENVDKFWEDRLGIEMGAQPKVLVRTDSGKQIYPRYDYYEEFGFSDKDSFAQDENIEKRSEIAEQNLEILKDGIELNLDVRIPRSSLLAGLVLGFYILIFSSILILSYRKNVKHAEKLLTQQHQEMKRYQEQLENASAKLQSTYDREREYQEQIQNLRKELTRTDHKLQSTEENALEEIEDLEKKLQENVESRKEKESEIEALKKEIEKFEQTQNKQENKKAKQEKQVLKRFNALYKNLNFEQKAVQGFLDLNLEHQLKAEKLIHSLDLDHNQVKVKRKVFLKKGDMKVLETEFSYNGRLYWTLNSNSQIHILNIGTKDTQKRDLGYIENLAG